MEGGSEMSTHSTNAKAPLLAGRRRVGGIVALMLSIWIVERVVVSCVCFSVVVIFRKVWSSLQRSQRESLRDPELGRRSERAFLLPRRH